MLELVEQQMRSWVLSLEDPYITSLYDNLAVGKRLRAKLVMLIAKDHPNAVKLASIIELIHAASLLHDDVIDDAELRRGQKSVNATEGSKTAIMVGDILYSKAYFELVALGPDIAQLVANAVTMLSHGELLDVEMAKSFNSDESKYMDMIYKKTASLIEATTASAAILVGKDRDAYALYGKNLGLAFQIIDDILDITSDEATLGKPVLNDYREGKVTLPYIHLYHQCARKEKLELAHAKDIDAELSQWIIAQIKEYGTIEQSYELAQKLSNEALQAVAGDIALEQVLTTMMQRNF
ncbi:MAG: polyprenyl synthetase family protein [Thiovulaceae bacterium]|nr:polyprenyl synthetase family protein [Sulfurimonadaceae bacterium]